MALQAINVIYKLAEHPDKLCARLIKNLATALLIDQPASKTTVAPNENEQDGG